MKSTFLSVSGSWIQEGFVVKAAKRGNRFWSSSKQEAVSETESAVLGDELHEGFKRLAQHGLVFTAIIAVPSFPKREGAQAKADPQYLARWSHCCNGSPISGKRLRFEINYFAWSTPKSKS